VDGLEDIKVVPGAGPAEMDLKDFSRVSFQAACTVRSKSKRDTNSR